MKNKIKNVLCKIKKFIKGFFKVEYKVELQDGPKDLDYIIHWQMKDTIASITRVLSFYPINNVKFGLKNYSIEKIDNEYLTPIVEKLGCKSFTKMSSVFYKTTHTRETNLKHQAYCVGIDHNVWKFEFNTFFIYNSWNTNYGEAEEKILDLSVAYIDKFIEVMNLDNMLLKRELWVDPVANLPNVINRNFEGVIKTYGSLSNYNLFSEVTKLPEDESIDDYITFETVGIDEKSEIESIHDKSLLVDVIRKDSNDNTIIRGE